MNQRRAAGSTGVAYIRWLLRARPADYMLALSVAGGSLPVVGKHLKPLGGVTAIGVWGARHASDFLSATAKDLLTPGINEVRRRDRASTQEVSVAALRGIVSPDDLAVEWPAPERTPPVCGALRHRRYVHRRRVLYGDDPAQLLDVWRRKDMPTKPAPVLIFVPGGAWVHGSRAIQGYAVLSRLAAQGWVCLSIDYRVAPHHRWPRHILDVKTAIAWARANVDKFGGTAISLRWLVVRPAATCPRWPGSPPTTRNIRPSCQRAPTRRSTRWWGFTAATTGRTAPPRNVPGSSIFWSG